jgi:hypothetical protein
MRDKEFHALCAAQALNALILKHKPKGLTSADDPYFAYVARGAMTYADRMVELRKLRRNPWRMAFLWISGWTTWMYATDAEMARIMDHDEVKTEPPHE